MSIGLAAVTFAVILSYFLGAQALLLQTPQAEEGHNLFISIFKPLLQAIAGGHRSMAQIHGGSSPVSEQESNYAKDVRVPDTRRNESRTDRK